MVNGSFIIFLLVLATLAFMVWLSANFLGSIFGPNFNRFNPFVRQAKSLHLQTMHAKNRNPHAMPVCGKCGYPAQGISTLYCPECGADLREVGIKLPGQGSGSGWLFLTLLVYSIVFMIFCGTISEVIDAKLPTYMSLEERLGLSSTHNNYDVEISIQVSETKWGNTSWNSFGFTAWSLPTNGTMPLQITFDGLTPQTQIDALTLAIDLGTIPSGASVRPVLQVDPNTMVANWQGLNGKPYLSSGPIADQDILSFLETAGLDKTQPQIIADAQQLHALIEGLALRKTQFTLSGFTTNSTGGNSISRHGPQWFWPLYIAVCIVIWVIGLDLCARWLRRRTTTQTKS